MDKEDIALFDKGWRVFETFGGHSPSVTHLHGKRPYDYSEIELWREGWDSPQLIDPARMHPAMNVFDLWWRPSGPLRAGR